MTNQLEDTLAAGVYQAYAYAYPHKTSYRPLESRALSEVWDRQDKSALFLYAHIPFCEMRCGFCNLFTMAKPGASLGEAYIEAFRKQARATASALGDANFAQVAVGGGTPTQLDDAGFEALFAILRDELGADLDVLPVACETSPETVTPSKVATMMRHGVSRVSIGVQSFIEEETKKLRRPQKPEVLLAALDLLRSSDIENLNIDLIYGIPGQTADSFINSIDSALQFSPDEVFLYPLYVRPLTGLGNSKRSWDDERLELYRQGRDHLLTQGYTQHSMRMFRKAGVSEADTPVYSCQSDGMVGLGAGARSYTDTLHYSSEYAVGRRGVMEIIQDWVTREGEDFSRVNYGFELNQEERKRRFLLLSLFNRDGVQDVHYADRFRSQPLDDFPQLIQLIERGLATKVDGRLTLTPAGLEVSDAITPWLFSERVVDLSAEYELR